MKFQTQIQTWRRRTYLTVATALPLLMMAPITRLHAEAAAPLPGSDFLDCENSAWSGYNKCLTDSSWGWERKLCDLVFEGNIAYCTSVFYHRVHDAS